jgi:hypothetical protein
MSSTADIIAKSYGVAVRSKMQRFNTDVPAARLYRFGTKPIQFVAGEVSKTSMLSRFGRSERDFSSSSAGRRSVRSSGVVTAKRGTAKKLSLNPDG